MIEFLLQAKNTSQNKMDVFFSMFYRWEGTWEK